MGLESARSWGCSEAGVTAGIKGDDGVLRSSSLSSCWMPLRFLIRFSLCWDKVVAQKPAAHPSLFKSVGKYLPSPQQLLLACWPNVALVPSPESIAEAKDRQGDWHGPGPVISAEIWNMEPARTHLPLQPPPTRHATWCGSSNKSQNLLVPEVDTM